MGVEWNRISRQRLYRRIVRCYTLSLDWIDLFDVQVVATVAPVLRVPEAVCLSYRFNAWGYRSGTTQHPTGPIDNAPVKFVPNWPGVGFMFDTHARV